MYCENCGSEIVQGSKFCGNCGAPVKAAANPVEQPYLYQSQQETTAAEAPQLPMKWFNFLTKFALIAGAVLNFLASLTYLTGTIESEGNVSPEYVYSMYPGLKFCDIFMGLALIAIGVFAIITRNKLAKFKADGPKSLYITYVLNIAAVIAYAVWTAVVTGTFNFSVIGSVVIEIGYIVLNYIYFNKRKQLFVN